jgi:hypothetical protein
MSRAFCSKYSVINQTDEIFREMHRRWHGTVTDHHRSKTSTRDINSVSKVKISLLQAMEAHRVREVKAPTLLRQTANRWRQGCQPYAPAALYPQVYLFFKDYWYSFLLEAESTPGPMRPEGLGQFKKSTSSGH